MRTVKEAMMLKARHGCMGRNPLVLVFFLISVGLLSLCAVGERLAPDQNLRVGMTEADIGHMDPHQTKLGQDTPVQDAVWELLVAFEHPGDVTSPVIPLLAESWETSEDGLTWTFRLREGVVFHYGYGEMTADDVKFSFDRAVDPQRSGITAQPPWPYVAETIVVDRYTVKVRLSSPVPDLLQYFAFMQTGAQVLSKRAVEEAEVAGRLDWTSAESGLVGTGPWQYGSYVPGGHFRVVRNEDYWQGRPTLDTITFLYVPSHEARTMAFLAEELHICKMPIDQALVDMFLAQGRVVDVLGPGFSAVFAFNMSRPPLDNWLVRAAIAYAIDRQELADGYGPDVAAPQISMVPEGWLYGTYDDIPTYDYNPELAKTLLAAAGYPDGLKLRSFTSPSDYYRIQFELLQAQLVRVGIDLELVAVDHTTFHANQRQNMQDLVLFGNGGWTGEAHLHQFWHSAAIITEPTAVLNFAHYGEIGGTIDDLLDLAVGKAPEAKQELYAAAQRRILVDLAGYPTIWIRFPIGRQPYVDLGYEPVDSMTTGSISNITWQARILQH